MVLLTDGPGLAKRLVEVLGEHEVGARVVVAPQPEAPGPVAEICTASWGPGVSLPGLGAGLTIVSEQDLTGQAVKGSTSDMRRMPSRRRKMVDPLQLNPGDFIVHEQHGVGRFIEMVQRTVGGATRDQRGSQQWRARARSPSSVPAASGLAVRSVAVAVLMLGPLSLSPAPSRRRA